MHYAMLFLKYGLSMYTVYKRIMYAVHDSAHTGLPQDIYFALPMRKTKVMNTLLLAHICILMSVQTSNII